MIANFDARNLLTWDSLDIAGQKFRPGTGNETGQNAEQAIKVDISKEGMEAYKKMYLKGKKRFVIQWSCSRSSMLEQACAI